MTISSLGLGSGIDLQGILDGLMKIEATQQNALKTKVSAQQSKISTYQALNSQFASLQTAAEALSLPTNWKVFKATSSDASVTATANSSAVSGNFSFKVTQLAQGHVMGSSQTVSSLTDPIGGDGKSLSDIVNGINSDKNSAFTAAAVQTSPGQYKLQLSAKETGTANAISIDPDTFAGYGLGTLTEVSAAKNAVLSVGDGAGAYTITSATNTIKDALPGVTLQLNSADPAKTVNVKVGGDVDALANSVEKMISAANSALGYIRNNSKYDPNSSAAGSLLGNSVASQLSQKLFSSTLNPVSGTDLKTVDQVGIKTDASGNISFDKEKFKAAYAADPNGVASMFVEGGAIGVATPANPGIAERLAALAKSATNSTTGSITNAIKGLNKTIEDLNTQISSWDTRLAQRQDTLKKQFSALDVAISNYQSMGSWLSGQINNLPTWG